MYVYVCTFLVLWARGVFFCEGGGGGVDTVSGCDYDEGGRECVWPCFGGGGG